MRLHPSVNKFPSGQTGWCMPANPKVLTPITYGGEMRHTVPLYCYKSFLVDGWQLFIRSNLFKPPLKELTFSTLTHSQFTNHTADLLWGRETGGWSACPCSFPHRDSPLFILVGLKGGNRKWTLNPCVYLHFFPLNVLHCYVASCRDTFWRDMFFKLLIL